MIKFTTINVEGKRVEREFNSLAEILKNWWSEDTDLPSNDDEVVECTVDGQAIKAKDFYDLIQTFEIMYWKNSIVLTK